MALPTRRIIL